MARSDNREALEQLAQRLVSEYGETSGLAILHAVYEELGGLRITIPTIRCLEKTERIRRIRNTFNGVNHQELAIRWGMSVRQVRRIVNCE
jgi:Mor family transcriptional regulator